MSSHVPIRKADLRENDTAACAHRWRSPERKSFAELAVLRIRIICQEEKGKYCSVFSKLKKCQCLFVCISTQRTEKPLAGNPESDDLSAPPQGQPIYGAISGM